MACPQCGDPVDCIGIQGGCVVHRCPVCGTQTTGSDLTLNYCIEVPHLIAKLRAFEGFLKGWHDAGQIGPGAWELWGSLGIRDVIKKGDQR